MTHPEPKPTDQRPPPAVSGRLKVKLRLAQLALAWERLWPELWPVAGVAGLFAVVALFDLLPLLPAWLHALVLAAFAAAFLWFAGSAVRRFAVPGTGAARRRLERASGLSHRPLTAVEDRLASGAEDPHAKVLWRVHQRRMAEAARRLRVGWPAPGLARRDPAALRGALVLLLVVAAAYGWHEAPARLARALTPEFAARPASAVAFDLWITPPAYTGMAPVFPIRLAAAAKKQAEAAAKGGSGDPVARAVGPLTIKVPAGSVLTAQMLGQGRPPVLHLAGTETPFQRVDESHSRIETTLKSSGLLAVRQDGRTLGEWTVEAVPDLPPSVAFADKPSGTPHAALRISFIAADDYGLASVKAEIRRSYEKGAVIGKEVTTLDLGLPGRAPKTAKETGFHDLAPHKWAGLPVLIELVATDAMGQTTRTERMAITLPERIFTHPVARALIEQRKRLIEAPERREPVARAIEDIAARPDAFNGDPVVFLALISARSRLRMDPDEKAVDSVRDLLWDTALRLEDGHLSIAERELRRLQQELMRALAQGAPDSELERLMAELRRAMDRFMREMVRQMMQAPRNQQEVVEFDPSTMRLIDMGELQRMLDQIRDLMRAGARQAAREMLARLQQMMESLRSMQVMRMRGGAMQGRGALQQLQNLIRRQQQLMDRTFRQGQPGRGGTPSPAEQRALQQMLQQLRNMMQGMQQGDGQGPGQFLDRANDAMERAVRALERGRPGEAVGPQGEALDQLRRAGRGLMQQMMERFARESGLRPDRTGRRGQPRRDPLGREIMGEEVDASDVTIPDQNTLERAREILDELRRRAGQSHRPRIELDYINRLLDRF